MLSQPRRATAPAAITFINSTTDGGDLWVLEADVASSTVEAILALESYGVSPRRMTLGDWLRLTARTRTQTAPAHMDRATVGLSVPCFFRPVVEAMLAL